MILMENVQKQLNTEKTIEIINSFYKDCLSFWEREKSNYAHNYDEEIVPKQAALKDVSQITTNPYKHSESELLDQETLIEWIKNMEHSIEATNISAREMYKSLLAKVDENSMMKDGKYLFLYENAQDLMDEIGATVNNKEEFNWYLQEEGYSSNSPIKLELDDYFIVLDNSGTIGGHIFTKEDTVEQIVSFMKSEPSYAKYFKGTSARLNQQKNIDLER